MLCNNYLIRSKVVGHEGENEMEEKRLENRFIALEKEIRANFRWMIGMWITVVLMFISTMLTIILKVG